MAIPALLWLLPATFFDDTGITLCPSKYFFGIECLGCGMTRAVMHLHHFELEKSLGFNRGVVVVYPLLVALWCILVKNTAHQAGLLKAPGDQGA